MLLYCVTAATSSRAWCWLMTGAGSDKESQTANPALPALVYPHRDVGGFQGLPHHTSQVGADRLLVHSILQPGRERLDHAIAVIPDSVEPPVHHPLHS